jgi:hypothetical protein
MNNRFIICICLWAWISAIPAYTEESTNDAAAASKVPALGIVRVNVLVPQREGATDSFMIYPYPIKPPTNERKLKPLPKNMKELRQALFDSGYSGRVNPSKVYPSPSWRWRYIFQTAVEKSRMPLPNNVVSVYGWVDAMIPYVLPELRKVKAAERTRIARYNKAVEFWDLNNVDLENQATMTGRHSYEIAVDKKWIGRARLPVGTWWVVGVHKLPSLVFYWQEPVKITQGGTTSLNLDEWNAIIVQGSW